jgi:hypothetical protein
MSNRISFLRVVYLEALFLFFLFGNVINAEESKMQNSIKSSKLDGAEFVPLPTSWVFSVVLTLSSL